MAARSSWALVQGGRFGAAGLRAAGRRPAAVVLPLGPGVRRGGRPSVTDDDLRASWYLPAARSSLVRSSSTRYWSAALFTATAAIVSGVAFCSRHSRLVQ